MGRLKGSKNKTSELRPITSSLSSQERINLIANLIIEKIKEDQNNGCPLLKRLTQSAYGLPAKS